MNDYISRDDVLKAIDYQHEVNNVFESEAAYVQMWEMINDDMGIKATDVLPVKHGQWKQDEQGYDAYVECSECGLSLSISDYIENEWREILNYCPCCGVRMDGDIK